MSFALRAKAGREQGGAFVFPEFEGWTKLHGWKYGLSKTKNRMFTLELKIIEKGDLKGKIVKERVVISSKAEWQFDKFLAYLEDSGIDLEGMDDTNDYKAIKESLEFLEDSGQKIKVHLVPQEEDKRYYRLTFLEVEKCGEGAGGPVVVDPADDEDPGQAPDGADPEPEEEAPPPPPPVVRRAATVAPAATKPAVTTPAATTAAAPAKKPWQR